MSRATLVITVLSCISSLFSQTSIAAPQYIKATLHSFSCGADSCYLSVLTDKKKEISGICGDHNFCFPLTLIENNTDLKLYPQKVHITLDKEFFKPAGEKINIIKKVKF